MITWDDIKRQKDNRVFVCPVIMRTDRIVLTPNGPVAVLLPGESFIEFGAPYVKESDETRQV